MSDEAPKSLDTVRPPEGDEDVYSASTKVGQAAPEIMALVAKAEAEAAASAALKPARVPSGVDLGLRIENAPVVDDVPAEKPKPELAGEAAAAEAAETVADVAAEAPASTEEASPVRTEQGIPPLSLLVLVVAVGIAAWLGYQAMHAPPPAPANAPAPVGR